MAASSGETVIIEDLDQFIKGFKRGGRDLREDKSVAVLL